MPNLPRRPPPSPADGPGPASAAQDGDSRDLSSPADRPGNADPTVGTGSVVAIGCVLGLLLLVLAGVAFLILLRIL